VVPRSNGGMILRHIVTMLVSVGAASEHAVPPVRQVPGRRRGDAVAVDAEPGTQPGELAGDGAIRLLVRLLGPVRAWQGDRELELGGPQRQVVLALLALRANQAVSRSELIDGIWGEDPPPSAVNALHVHVAGLRRELEPNRASRAPGKFLLASGPGYSLRREHGQLDAQVFGRHLDAALRIWQAAPLSGAPGPWAEIERVPSLMFEWTKTVSTAWSSS
jgi:hypothetical protein